MNEVENADIRILAMQNRVKLYQIAEYLGIWDSTLSRKLRHELPEGEKAAIVEAIHSITNGGVKDA